jgi:hypothetical protein
MQKPSDSTAMMKKRFLRDPEKGGKIPSTGHRSAPLTKPVPAQEKGVLGVR